MANSSKLYTEKTDLVVVGGAVVIAALGIIALLFAELKKSEWDGWVVGLLIVGGQLLAPTAALALLWELLAKRAFYHEILAKLEIRDEVRDAGLVGFEMNYLKTLDWSKELESVHELDIFFVGGSTWRNAFVTELREIGKSKDKIVRICLPDPDNPALMTELAGRFKNSAQDVASRLRTAATEFQRLLNGCQYRIYYSSRAPLYALYRLDEKVLVTLYMHQPQKGEVPAFVFEKPGRCYEFAVEEFSYLISAEAGARLVPAAAINEATASLPNLPIQNEPPSAAGDKKAEA